MIKRYKTTREKRKIRVRGKLFGTSSRPRLSVHRTNKHIYAQIIDDELGKTIVSSSDITLPKSKSTKSTQTKTQKASLVGTNLAQDATKAKIKAICFDRGQNKFHGRIKALAQAARDNGLEF